MRRESSRAQPRGGLGGAQQADHHRGRQRGEHEHGLVEGEHVGVERRVAPERRADEHHGAAGGDDHAAPLALEVRVGGDQEQRGQADAAERVGRHELEQQQEREVDSGDDRVERPVRLRARGGQQTGRPEDEDGQHHRRAPVVREAHGDHGEEATTAIGEPRRGEHQDRPGRLDRDAPHQARSARADRASARRGGARRVDEPVDRGAVATLDEGLVELVGEGVAARRSGTPVERLCAGSSTPRAPPPQKAQERVLGEVDQLAADQVDHAEARVEARLRREREDHAHEGERREPQVQVSAGASPYRRVSRVLVITSKSPYAVRALAELARRGDARPVPIGDLARARDIPVQFLEGLFATLRRAGILQSQRGVKGGYSFARPPSEVTVLEVVDLLEGELGADAAANGPVWTESGGRRPSRPGRHDDRRRGRARGARLGGADVLQKEGPPTKKKTTPSKIEPG